MTYIVSEFSESTGWNNIMINATQSFEQRRSLVGSSYYHELDDVLEAEQKRHEYFFGIPTNPTHQNLISTHIRNTRKATFKYIDSGTEEHEYIPMQPKRRTTIKTRNIEKEIQREGFVKVPPLATFKVKGTVKSIKLGTVNIREPIIEHNEYIKIPPKMAFKLVTKKKNDSEIK